MIHSDLQSGTGTGTGGLSLGFRFGTPALSCADAGVDHVHVFVTDIDDAVVPGSDQTVPCASLPVAVAGMSGGTYFVNAEGLSASVRAYWTQVYGVTVGPGATGHYTVDLPQSP